MMTPIHFLNIRNIPSQAACTHFSLSLSYLCVQYQYSLHVPLEVGREQPLASPLSKKKQESVPVKPLGVVSRAPKSSGTIVLYVS